MVFIQSLTRRLNSLGRRLDMDDIPPASLLFLGGCLILALIGFFSWRSDRILLANGREIRAEVIDRRTKITEDCDDGGCTTEISYFLTYQYFVDDAPFEEEQVVDRALYDRTESTILIRYLPDKPATSNVAETVKNVLPFPLFSVVAILIGLIGAAVIFWIS